jgi:hypothetical protein
MAAVTTVNGEKYRSMQEYVHGLKVRDVRNVFAYFRRIDNDNPNIFFPHYGLTAGEFTVMYIQNMTSKGKKGSQFKGSAVGEAGEDGNDTWTADDAM